MRFKKVFLAIGLLLFSLPSISFSLEPRLLWKREFKKAVSLFELAKGSGDVIFAHEIQNEPQKAISIVNKNGETIMQWGPKPERVISSVSISKNGMYFAFESEYDYETAIKKNYSFPLIHYWDRTKGELWKTPYCGIVKVSPDGKYIFVSSPCSNLWEGESFIFDNRGALIWKKDIGSANINPIFLPDGKYIWNGFYIIDIKGKIHKEFSGEVSSFSENFEYIATEKSGVGVEVKVNEKLIRGKPIRYGAILDKEGNIILEGRARVSSNGKIGVIFAENKVQIYRLPEKILLKEYPIIKLKFESEFADISYDGNIIVIMGKRTDIKSDNNLFVINLKTNSVQEFKVEKEGQIFLTDDGKYLLIWIIKGFYFYRLF